MRPFSLRSSSGFSLVELMVALVLTSIVTIVIYRSYAALRVGIDKHEQDCEIHQNLRVGLQRLASELRMAAYDPMGGADSGFIVAMADQVRFTVDYDRDNDLISNDIDLDGNGTPELWADEDVTYALVGTNLVRTDHNDNLGAGSTQTIIPNVDALHFVYYDGSNPPELLPKPVTTTFDRDQIRDIDIILVVRATNEDFSYTNNRTYLSTVDEDATAGNDVLLDRSLPADNDHFRRGRMVARVKARNAGLQ